MIRGISKEKENMDTGEMNINVRRIIWSPEFH
jgi:hypothetical protein